MSFTKIIKDLKIDNAFTNIPKKQRVFNKVKNNLPPVKGYNYEADLLFLPQTDNGNKYLLVVIDLADNSFDIEELKNKDPSTVLNAFKAMFKRQFIKQPQISIRTDSGSEFKSVFDKFLNDNNIIHSVSLPDRHRQTGNVENLNKELGNVFNSYMNSKELETGETYNNWDDITDVVRKEGNKIKKIDLPKYSEWDLKLFDPVEAGEAKYKIGDFVYRKLDAPKNALGHTQSTKKFRMGDYRWDTLPRKILKVCYFSDAPWYRYMIEGIPNASYGEIELKPAKGETEQKYDILKFEAFKKEKGVEKVLIHWKGYSSKDNTWENVSDIKKDIGEKHYNSYLQSYKDEIKKLDDKLTEQIRKAQEKEQLEKTFLGLRRSERLKVKK